ncbi:chromosome partitioning protein [Mycetocola zhujimingii]|uniref:chromosome partitioning protein n=1 Tax=Mycetocola zhujimingii TaxID=2079792 RepID=UPI000D3AE394|nr:chromosome partitioning protein [Mycetocola zhujimingii]AWB87476.1 chromosome partitioning protein [Mycetocola zhujimingii]
MSNEPNESTELSEPWITAVARADGTGMISVDGAQSDIRANDVAEVRAAIIARVTDEAKARNQRVLVAITDLDGVYLLSVHPDGNVESEGPVVPDAGAAAQGATAAGSGSEPAHTQEPEPETRPTRQPSPAEGPARGAGPTRAVLNPAFGEATPVIPPPPFGIDDLIDFAESGSEPTPHNDKGSEPAPTRRSTFRSYSEESDLSQNNSGSAAPAEGAPSPTARPDAGRSAEHTASSEAAELTFDQLLPTPGRWEKASAPSTEGEPEAAPTLEDFLQSRPSAPEGPAKQGWQGAVRRVTGGLISPRPGKAERAHRDAIRRVQRSLKGPRTIVVLNPKGGAHKTTATLLLAATFGTHRGGSTLAWDNNETRGTLGWRAQPSVHSNTAVDLLRDLGRFSDVESARVGYLDNYVRGQGDAQFDVLASDEDAAASSTIDADAFRSLHSTLSRFYRVLVIDTGNNMRASNWEAAVEAADQLVVVTTVNEETAASAAWLIDGLRQKGHQDKVSQAVTILSSPGDTVQPELTQRLRSHFSALTRVVLEVPYDPGFQGGGPLNVDVLSPQTREAWLQVTAAVADGL